MDCRLCGARSDQGVQRVSGAIAKFDHLAFRARLDAEGAFLHHWVINSTDITATLAAAQHDAGLAIPMRRASLEWQICVRDDGILPRDGILPTVIQWPDIPHPAGKMGDLGLTLEVLHVHSTDPEKTLAELAAIGATGFCTVHQTPVELNSENQTRCRRCKPPNCLASCSEI